MQGKSVTDRYGKTRYYLEGREVTKRQYDRAIPDKPIGAQSLAGFPPLASDSLAVHPDQIPEAIEQDRKQGLSVNYLPDGRPVFESKGEFLRYVKRKGFFHKGYV